MSVVMDLPRPVVAVRIKDEDGLPRYELLDANGEVVNVLTVTRRDATPGGKGIGSVKSIPGNGVGGTVRQPD